MPNHHGHLHGQQFFLAFLVGMIAINLLAHVVPEVIFEAKEHRLLNLITLFIAAGVFFQYALHHILSPCQKTAHQFLTALHFHNLTDGITIGLGFLVSLQFGLTILGGIMIHDLIHKIIAFNFLTRSGDSKKGALKKTLPTLGTITIGAVTTLWLQPSETVVVIGGAFAAGSLAYVVWMLVNEIIGHSISNNKKNLYFLLGATLMYSLMTVLETLLPIGH